ncbi:MAG TPA: outer membrane protein transport protein [Anaeromyxobacter sp.]|nr:outer membrane protein transport protein [Anaeromyxobacter sp.]
MRGIQRALAVAALFAAGPASATNGMRMIGFGPVQGSMGGVGVGATLDGSALVSNPAGIAGLGSRLDVALGYFKPTVSHQATGTPTGMSPPYPPSMFTHDGQSVDSRRAGSPIPAIAYIQPLGDRLSAGLGLFAVSGMGVDYPTNIYQSKALTSYLNARLSPGLAYRLSESLSVGLALNVMMAQMEYDVAGNLPPDMGGQARHKTATSWGYGATLGVKFTPVEMLSLGAAYETRSRFQDFTFDVPGGQDRLRFDQPQVATLGAALRPFDPLLLAADLEWINWSATMGQNLPRYSQSQPGTMPWNMNWKDQWVVKLGAQVQVSRGLELRAGYNYGKMPLDKARAFENLVFPAVAEQHFTAGGGYSLTNRLAVALTAMYSPRAKISGANPGPPQLGGQMIDSYSAEMSQFEVDLGASFRF